MTSRTDLPEWRALRERAGSLSQSTIRGLFEPDPGRAERFVLQAPGVRADFSRQLLDQDTLELLLAFARACRVEGARDAMFRGEPVNGTEQRPAWHTALRTPPQDAEVERAMSADRARMLALASRIRSEHADGRLKHVLVLGIGGSDLGPRLVTTALGRATGPTIHFVSNLDPMEFEEATSIAAPDETAVIAVSKSFGTLETLENLKAATRWLGPRGAERVYAVTAAAGKAQAMGIAEERILTMPEWVGGRFSVWSACGLPVAIAHGQRAFEELLAGARAMDGHFADAALALNVPVILALLDVWNSNFLGHTSRAVFPYTQRLHELPAYLQQLEMESCGKSVDTSGNRVSYPTGRVIWGGAGTTAQHSVFQFLHQGTEIVPCELLVLGSHRTSRDRRERLLAEFALAQADALAFGDFSLPEKFRPATYFAQCPGSRPSVVIELTDLEPRQVGALLAMNEHRTVVRSTLLDINAFDQWGVEIGKRLLALREPVS